MSGRARVRSEYRSKFYFVYQMGRNVTNVSRVVRLTRARTTTTKIDGYVGFAGLSVAELTSGPRRRTPFYRLGRFAYRRVRVVYLVDVRQTVHRREEGLCSLDWPTRVTFPFARLTVKYYIIVLTVRPTVHRFPIYIFGFSTPLVHLVCNARSGIIQIIIVGYVPMIMSYLFLFML